MIIGIDGNEANVENKVGIGQFAFELLRVFAENGHKYGFEFQIYLKDDPCSHMPFETKNWRYIKIGPKKFWTQLGLPVYLYTHNPKPDVIFSPTHYAPRFSPVPSVVSVMDMSFIHYPEMFKSKDLYQLKNWTEYSVNRASKVITISQASKDDIIKEYKIDRDSVQVIYPGVNYERFNQASTMEEVKKKYNIPDKYILFVGTLQPRKNIVRLIQAFKKVIQNEKFQDLKLVVIGKKGWHYDEILSAPRENEVDNKVMFLDFVPDEDMPPLYRSAEVFVLPSLYEGFGLPILEAMKYGCPVITSNVSSMPEVGGDAAVYCDPESVEDIKEKILMVLSSPKLQKSLREKGKIQIKKFDWEKSADKVLSVLESVAKS